MAPHAQDLMFSFSHPFAAIPGFAKIAGTSGVINLQYHARLRRAADVSIDKRQVLWGYTKPNVACLGPDLFPGGTTRYHFTSCVLEYRVGGPGAGGGPGVVRSPVSPHASRTIVVLQVAGRQVGDNGSSSRRFTGVKGAMCSGAVRKTRYPLDNAAFVPAPPAQDGRLVASRLGPCVAGAVVTTAAAAHVATGL